MGAKKRRRGIRLKDQPVTDADTGSEPVTDTGLPPEPPEQPETRDTGDHAADWTMDEPDDTDDADQVDVDGLVAHVRTWADEHDAEPPPSAVVAEIRYLAGQWATPIVQDAFVSVYLGRWCSELRAKERDRKTTMLNRTWKQEAEEVQAALRAEAIANLPPVVVPSEEEVRAALREELWPKVEGLAKDPNLFERAVKQVQALGVVGEDDIIRTVYLAGTSRVTHKPVNPLISGASAGGKSFVSQQTLRLLPPEDVVVMTTGSALSMVYDAPEDTHSLSHKVICVYEATQLQQDDNSTFALCLRTLISEGRIVHKTVQTDPSGYRQTETIIKLGPVVLIITTTATDIHAENETRMTRMFVHEDTEQTKAIIRRLGVLATRGRNDAADDIDLSQWQDFQRWVGAGSREVIIPYADRLTDGIPPAAVRFRRDVSAVLSLIQAHALLYQAQREKTDTGAIIATVDDYAAIWTIAARILEESAGKRPSERVVAVVQHVEKALTQQADAAPKPAKPGRRAINNKQVSPHRDGDVYVASVRSLGEELGLDRKSAEHAIRRALDDGFVVNTEVVRGRPMRLKMGTRQLADVGVVMLPAPEKLQ
jgi:hypothetical protein